MIDMNDPRLQQILQKRMAKEYWGGVAGFAPEIAAYGQQEAKRGVQMGDVYLRKQMQGAQMEQMTHEQKMAEKNLGLATGYLGLGQQEFGLKEKGYSISERGMGISERNQSIAEQVQQQRQAQGSWENKWFNKNLDQKSKELNLTTALGLGTAAWAGYEGYRRNQILTEDRNDTKEFKRKLREKGLLI
jgi:hypothetical protein